ncbi:MAG: substrate-binding domain-containing protein [Oscillospiraceae bacterium]
MKRVIPVFLILSLLLSGCGIIARVAPATPTPSALPEFVFTRENFPDLAAGPSLSPLAEAVAALLLGESRDSASGILDVLGTGDGFSALSAGDCGLLLAAEPSDALLAKLNGKAELAPVARDALVFWVSDANSAESLTSAQLSDIFTGKTTNWSQLGGENIPIVPFVRDGDSGSRMAAERLLTDGKPLVGTESAVFDGDEGAIGLCFYHYADAMKMTDGRRLLSVDGVAPSAESIAAAEYPFVARYVAAISASAAEGSPERVLWAWLQGAEGQKFIVSEGYVPAAD